MSKILMPIKPKYVDEILSGRKKYEYRTIKPKRNVDKMIIYSTYPVMKIVAEVDIIDILEDTSEKVWEKTKEYSSTTKEAFDNYYKNKKVVIAYKLGNINVYEIPKELKDFGINYYPQSFVYIK